MRADGAKEYSNDNVYAAVTDFVAKIDAYKAVFEDEGNNNTVDFVSSNVDQATSDLIEAMDNTSALLPRLLYEIVEEGGALSKALQALNVLLDTKVAAFGNKVSDYLESFSETDTLTQWKRIVFDPQKRLLDSIKNLLDPSISQRTNPYRDVAVADCSTNDPITVFSLALDILSEGCAVHGKRYAYDDMMPLSSKDQNERCLPFLVMDKNAYSRKGALKFLRLVSDVTITQIFATMFCFGARAWPNENDAKRHNFKQVANSSAAFMSIDFLDDYKKGTAKYDHEKVYNATQDFLDAVSVYDQIFRPNSTVIAVVALNRTTNASTAIRKATNEILELLPAIYNEDRFEKQGLVDAAELLLNFANEKVDLLNDDIEQHLSWIETTNPILDWNQAVRDPIVRLKYSIEAFLHDLVLQRNDVSPSYVAEACRDNDPGAVFGVAWDRIAGGCQLQKRVTSRGAPAKKYAPKRCRIEQIMDANTYTTNGTMLVMRFIADVVVLQTFASTFCLGIRSWPTETALRTQAHEDIIDRSTEVLQRQIPEFASRYFTTSGYARKIIATEAAMRIDSTNISVRYRQMENATIRVRGKLDATYKDWVHGIWWWSGWTHDEPQPTATFTVGWNLPLEKCGLNMSYVHMINPYAVDTASKEKYGVLISRVAGTEECAKSMVAEAKSRFEDRIGKSLPDYYTETAGRLCSTKQFTVDVMNQKLSEVLPKAGVFNQAITALADSDIDGAFGDSGSTDGVGLTCTFDPKSPTMMTTVFTI